MAFIYNLFDTWVDSGIAYDAIKMSVTNTQSASMSNLIKLTVSGSTTASFIVDKYGNGSVSNTFAIGGATIGGNALAVIGSSAFTGDVTLGAAGAIRSSLVFANTTANSVTLQSSNSTSSAYTLTLPTTAGTNGYFLQTDGAGNLSWAAQSSGTVTSVNVSGGTTGLSFSGGPITSSGTITMAGTLAVANGGTGISSFGTGVATALGVNVGTAGAFVVNGGALGTPSSGTLTNATGLPISTGVSGLGTGIATFLATPSSANLAAAVTDETGSGPLVFATAPTFGTNITVGTVSSSTGILNFKGTTSGTVSLSVADAAGTWTMKLPTTAGTNGYYLQTDGSGNTTWAAGGGGGGGSPGGSTTQVQYNNAGAFAGSANLTFNGTTLTVANDALINSATVGRGAGNISSNLAFGYQALNANTTGAYNVAIGYQALTANTTGVYNIAIGSEALTANTTATRNTAIGYQALFKNTDGTQNFALGWKTLYENTTGSYNVALGYDALHSNTTGSYNFGLGTQALNYNTTGVGNVAIGSQALYVSTTGSNNIGIGLYAQYSNDSGSQNIAIGGGDVYGTLGSNLSGNNNIAIGYEALGQSTVNNNIAIGYNALFSNTTGASNVAVGYSSGSAITTGSNNVILGGYTGSAAPISATGSNYIVLSDGAATVRQIIDGSGNVDIATLGATLKLRGATSGDVTIKTAAVAGTATNFQLPASNGTNNYVLTTNGSGVTSWSQVSLTAGVTGVLPVANGGTNSNSAGITAFNNITGYTASGATGTTSTNLVFSTAPTITGEVLAAGTNTVAPLTLTSGTNLGTPAAGAVEYDGTIFSATSNTSFKRGTVPITNYASGTGSTLGTNTEATLAVLLPAANDTITLPIGTYYLELAFIITRGPTSTTSATARVNLLGTGGAAGSFSGVSLSAPTSGGTTGAFSFDAVNINVNNVLTAASTTAAGVYQLTLRGLLKITTAGTIVPQYNLSANINAAGTVAKVFYFKLEQIDSQSAAASGPAGTGWG